MIYALSDKRVELAADTYVAPGAVVIGNVVLGKQVSIWFNAVLRGDNDAIVVGEGSNIQDGAVLHVDPGHPLAIGRRVTVGHKAILHGCTIGDNSLIGMNAVVLNGAVIGKNCLIGANALVTEGMQIPDNSLVLGSPAKVRKELDAKVLAMLDSAAQSYIDKIALYAESLVEQV